MSIHVPSSAEVLRIYSGLSTTPKPHLRGNNLGPLVSSLETANASFAGQELYESIHSKVAAVVDSITRTHPLVDGNKRLSFLVMVMLYEGNGYTYVGGGSQADLFVWIADSHPDNDSIAREFSQLWI